MNQTDLIIHRLADAFCKIEDPSECYLTYAMSLESFAKVLKKEFTADVERDWEKCKEAMK